MQLINYYRKSDIGIKFNSEQNLPKEIKCIIKCFCYRSLDAYAVADPGGATGVRPPTGSISFIFAYVFAEKCMCRRLAPPPPTGRRPPNRKSWIHHWYV